MRTLIANERVAATVQHEGVTMLVELVLLANLGLVTAAMVMLNEAVTSRTVWRNFGLLAVVVVSASIVCLMARQGAFDGPMPARSIGWVLIIVSLAYVPFGVTLHRAHVRKVQRRRQVQAAATGDTTVVLSAEPIETTETGDILRMICYMLFVCGAVAIILG